MITISNKEASLLGLLNDKPMHAYEIEKEIEFRDMKYWTEISQSSIYKLLNKLEKIGLVISKVRLSDNNVAQKVYSITSLGKKSLKQKIKKIISAWQKPIRPIDIALSNLHLLSKKEVNESFKKYVESVDKMIDCYKDLQKYLEQHCTTPYVQLAVRPMKMLIAEKKWIMGFLEELNNE